ncbi:MULTISPECIES: permease prefix domain 1-containing protein [Streptomyces]|uniref:permease prefix domain 1-containing protein n=1 Tax=Streptomyces TaxID=1883 RepID=UPI001E4FA127|nr:MULTISPECIES: permease prefix domain 1-containing protein [Streptomyces]UFQ16154.1 permease prefix domain 1-containing protein [Streptomyces huasconensis]WCL85758.1 permease prefix domain 1-containing protein [Streptomyces sp. JCM 35825]
MSPADRLVQAYAADLTAALHGPAKAKSRLVEEVRDGLADTAAAYADAGLSEEEAARRAVREFGTVGELAPSCQRELTVAQARHTARAVTLTAPFLLGCWYLARTAGHDPAVARLLAVHLAFVATVAALLAAATLAATGSLARRLPTPQRLPLIVAWAGTTASGAMAAATLALAAAAALATDWTLLAFAGALAAAAHAAIAPSARTCRRCARLPEPTPG